ncbi:MAG: outer membrane protein assembly factor BamA [Deltaproteobacteria bacterium]|nr:outer membrane protein assembly factor BamA [Deltaproteobacteria bacterium]
MKKLKITRFSLILAFLTFFLQIISAYGQNDEVTVRISKVKIKGAKTVSKKEIKENTGTEFPSIKPWIKDPEFNEEILKSDMVRIERLYANYGYYDARAEYELKYSEEKDRVEITIKIKEGKPVILTELNINIWEIEDEDLRKKILDSVPLKVDKTFSPIKYQKTKGVISSILSDNGYPKANIKGEALVNRKEKWAKVSFVVNPGSLYRFGSISIKGNKDVESYIVRREVTYKEGEIYSTAKLDEARVRIFQLQLFRSVVIDTNFDDDKETVDTVITVAERKQGTVKIGVGYGTEDLFRGQIIWTKRNFFGGGRSLEVAGKFSFLTQRAEASFTQPYIIGGGSDLMGIFSLNRDDLPSFSSENIIGSTKVSKSFGGTYRAFGSFSIQVSQLSDISDATREFIESDVFFLTFFNLGIERNTTDNILNPKRGTVATASLESSFRTLGSDVNYLKAFVELKGYKEFSKVVLAKRVSLGVIQPFGSSGTLDVPIFKRFFAGGSTTMRGFPFQELGPLDDNEDPVGGNSLLLGSFEIRFPIYKDLGGVVFLDYGNVYPEEFDFKLDQIKYAVGTGLRYNTLVGPLRVDLGYALNPEPGIGRFQFFLSIGQAF